MNQSKTTEFQGHKYFDDRMFVLYLCKGTVEIEPDDDGAVWTKIYHEKAPEDHIWCVATYRNCNRYPLYRVDSFYKKEDAEKYMREIEPETPLTSLGGKRPTTPLSYEAYSDWKRKSGLKDYDWKSLYSAGGSNASESIGQTKLQFQGIK
ncbi:hypothetical protein L6260_01495 [Candidatus Parcubacteria bacterium]|nr:hypothetical protein [Candidatus Parcubacteria bacterium]MCG2712207.1 hypothetical protein [Candidatus Omnitrophota bacterium]